VVSPVGAVGAAVPESTGVKVNRVSKVLLPLAVLSLVEKVATMVCSPAANSTGWEATLVTIKSLGIQPVAVASPAACTITTPSTVKEDRAGPPA